MKILLVYASVGAGHLKAAEAVYQTLRDSSEHEVVFLDALERTNPVFRKLYTKTYSFLITHVPWAWGAVFWFLDIPCLPPLIRGFRRTYNTINARALDRYLIRENFDYIISSHFMPTEISAALKRAGKIRSKIITVITDFDVHRIWLADGVDHYTAASFCTRAKLIRLGVNPEIIHVTGIPTDQKFIQAYDISTLKKKLGLKQDAFTVLVATGSFGIGPIESIIASLSEFQIIVICGHNKNLYKKLSRQNQEHVKIMGLVDNMYELMAAADVMVTKPGGLSISEALVSGLPMIFFNPIPGQETNNINMLAQYGIGTSHRKAENIGQELIKLKSSKDLSLTALKKTKELARPCAVQDIIALLVHH